MRQTQNEEKWKREKWIEVKKNNHVKIENRRDNYGWRNDIQDEKNWNEWNE